MVLSTEETKLNIWENETLVLTETKRYIYHNLKLPLDENINLDRWAADNIIINKLRDTGLYDEVKLRLHKSAPKLPSRDYEYFIGTMTAIAYNCPKPD